MLNESLTPHRRGDSPETEAEEDAILSTGQIEMPERDDDISFHEAHYPLEDNDGG